MQYDISVIIEWENVLLAEEERCTRMLVQLRRQALALTRSVEVLVLFNPEQVERAVVAAAVDRFLLAPAGDGRRPDCRIEAGHGMHYYQLKNRGAELARGAVTVFIDSDVIPDDGWLQALTDPFWDTPDIRVLAGITYLDHHDLIGRAFALGWFFPLRSRHPVLARDSEYFFANNVAFRREVLEAHPFPDMADGMTRGACVALRSILARQGIAIWSNGAAQTCHPAPNGLAHFLARGFAQGRDWAMTGERRGIPPWRTGLRALRKVFSKTWRMLRRSLRHGRSVGLTAWQLPPAVLLMSLFYLEACLGAWAYVLVPRHTRRWWRI